MIGKGVEVMSYRDVLYPQMPSKPCTVAGCEGMMRFHPRQPEASAPHTLEWPWRATWVCDKDTAHFEVATDDEDAAVSRRPRPRR